MHSDRTYQPLRWQWAMLILSLWLATPAWADEVYLLNGDRITGTIVKMEEGVLTLQTDYGGEMKIAWGKVQRLTSTDPLRFFSSLENRVMCFEISCTARMDSMRSQN